jgi:hypothetical protein
VGQPGGAVDRMLAGAAADLQDPAGLGEQGTDDRENGGLVLLAGQREGFVVERACCR